MAAEQLTLENVRFNGSDYVPARDNPRLTGQILRIHALMRDGEWRTLGEIESVTGDPQASISAQLRHLRKPRFGGFMVNKRPRGDAACGLLEYQVTTCNAQNEQPKETNARDICKS